MNEKRSGFEIAAGTVCGRIKNYLRLIPLEVKEQAQEIRMRVNQPVEICCGRGVYFIRENGGVGCLPEPGNILSSKQDIEETFRNLCCYSVYSHQNEIKNGYITIRGGHRVGICGSAVVNSGEVTGIRDISSLNIRIARQVNGCADELFHRLGGIPSGGILLAGPPSSGKTTLLRDIARQLSSGERGEYKKVAVIDERGELAGSFSGIPQNDLGVCCDVLDGYPKGEGILQAIRSLSPEYVVFDELGSAAEADAVAEGLNSGVFAITSIHAGGIHELMRRKQAEKLMAVGAFSHVVILGGRTAPGKITGIYKAGELIAETDRNACRDYSSKPGGLYGIA